MLGAHEQLCSSLIPIPMLILRRPTTEILSVIRYVYDVETFVPDGYAFANCQFEGMNGT